MKTPSLALIVLATGLFFLAGNTGAWAAQCADGAVVEDDMRIIIPCVSIHGTLFKMEMTYHVDPALPEGFYWKLDAATVTATTADADMDGHSAPADCDDSDPDIHPGADEIWGDKIDQNCIPSPFD